MREDEKNHMCVLCGASITVAPSVVDVQGTASSSATLWQTRYRFRMWILGISDLLSLTKTYDQVYRQSCKARQPSRCRLSGVAVRHHSDETPWVAPKDEKSVIFYSVLDSSRSDDDLRAGHDVPLVHDRHRPFHESCWNLLEEYLGKDVLYNLYNTLYYIFTSLPRNYPQSHVVWGHTYGGLIPAPNPDLYPWDERRFRGTKHLAYTNDDPTWDRDQLECIYKQRGTIKGAAPGVLKPVLEARPDDEEDPFWTLPMEVREVIVCHLPARSLSSLRSASSAFWNMYYSPYFWAAQYKPGFDRDWIPRHIRGGNPPEWRRLFSLTEGLLENKARLWDKLFPIIKQAATLHWVGRDGEGLMPNPRRVVRSSGSQSIRGPTWHYRYHDPIPPFDRGCRYIRHQSVMFCDEPIKKVECSFFRLGDAAYVCGITFVTWDGETTKVGYETPLRESVDTDGVNGFKVATGPRGIQAIMVVNMFGTDADKWLGQETGCPQTLSCVTKGMIKSLSCLFDGCKMLCLQLPHAVLSPENGTLHQRALWWPQAPESHVHIGGCQDAALKNIHGFRPLIPLSIGGVHGQHLPYLTGITVRYCRYGINSIHFCYNSPESEIAPKVIGIEGDADQGFESHFPIDGANGERITGIHVFSRQAGEDLEPAVYEESLLLGNIIPAQPVAANPFRQPVVGEEPCSRAILVYTNHGRRRLMYRDGPLMHARSRRRILEVPSTHTVTGLYGTQGPLSTEGCGLRILGLLAENLQGDPMNSDLENDHGSLSLPWLQRTYAADDDEGEYQSWVN